MQSFPGHHRSAMSLISLKSLLFRVIDRLNGYTETVHNASANGLP
ncbi:UNVERIFIED_ORG: hypothetical protein M2193_004960 [Bradyrhizobium japonicum]